jgi:hypothetical protein
VDHGFVVVGSGFVVAHAAAVLVDPRETSLDHPNAGPDVETSIVDEKAARIAIAETAAD